MDNYNQMMLIKRVATAKILTLTTFLSVVQTQFQYLFYVSIKPFSQSAKTISILELDFLSPSSNCFHNSLDENVVWVFCFHIFTAFKAYFLFKTDLV